MSGKNSVSIHAPRVGSDPAIVISVLEFRVSIHAPRVGSDSMSGFVAADAHLFQSTLPVWGATSGMYSLYSRV